MQTQYGLTRPENSTLGLVLSFRESQTYQSTLTTAKVMMRGEAEGRELGPRRA